VNEVTPSGGLIDPGRELALRVLVAWSTPYRASVEGWYAMVFAFIGVALVSFLGGLLAFRIKSRWCPTCGRLTVPVSDQMPPAVHGGTLWK
jgi:hypothetical protein